MKKSIGSKVIALAMILAVLVFSCENEALLVNEALASEYDNEFALTINDIDGSTQRYEMTFNSDDSTRGLSGGDTIIVDGIETEDFSTLLTGSVIEYQLENDLCLTMLRKDNKLTRTNSEEYFSYVPVDSVEWNDDYSVVIANYTNGETAMINIDEMDNVEQRMEYVSTLVVKFLGGCSCAQNIIGSMNEERVIDWATIAAIAALSYTACILIGNGMCIIAAVNSCGSGNVKTFKQICGAGYDVDGSFKLGADCSFHCK